ncbi:MAG TPA: hypothetical protein VEL07_20395 [Planctomycetota bacterium]|nr:hypothetical protein [Planctomycetota bacterium]
MTFERLHGLFKRGKREEAADKDPGAAADAPGSNATRHALPVPADDDSGARERRDLAQALDHGFTQVAGAMDRLNQHLRHNGELMTSLHETHAQLPALIQTQQKINGLVANAERGNQAVVQTLNGYLKQKDEAQQAMVRLLGQLNTAVIDQRQAQQDQVKLVMKLQNSNRRTLIGLLLVFMLCALVLFALVLVLAIRPELLREIGGNFGQTVAPHAPAVESSAPTAPAPIAPAAATPAPAPAPVPLPAPAPAPAAPASPAIEPEVERDAPPPPARALPPPVDLRADELR